jgi:sodium-coupled neutral amino acid transporter 11
MVTGRDEFSQKENYIYTIVYIAITWVISILFPKIDKIISIMGGLCAATLSFAIPTFCYVKLSGKPYTHYKNLSAIIIFGTLSMIGYISVGVTVFLIITG